MKTLLLALLIDRLWGDPPNRYHPVAWMGQYIAQGGRRAPWGRVWRLLHGASVLLGGAALSALAGYAAENLTSRFPGPLASVARAFVLKTTFSWQGLEQAATGVQKALQREDLATARRLLAWHLVSRDTRQLSPSQVAAATVESVAENTSDSIVAPLFYYILGGLPAALVYRFINTADAMLGYRDKEHEWLGKVPARVDDIVNILPARLTAAGFVAAAWLKGANAVRVWRVWRRDAHLTSSPNAGHPMSTMAGALGVELEKVGHYRLGREFPSPQQEDIGRALRLMRVAVSVSVLALAFLSRWRRNGRVLVEAVCKISDEMATFAEASVAIGESSPRASDICL